MMSLGLSQLALATLMLRSRDRGTNYGTVSIIELVLFRLAATTLVSATLHSLDLSIDSTNFKK